MEKKYEFLDKLFIVLTAITFIIPGFKSMDQKVPEMIYLSSIQVLISVFILFTKNLNYLSIIKNKSVLSFLLFLSFSFFSLFIAGNKQESIIELGYFFTIFVTLFNSIILFRKKNIEFYCLLITFLIFIESFKVIFEFWKRFDYQNPLIRSSYYAGFSANVNVTGFSILFKLPILFYTYLQFKGEKPLFKILIAITIFMSFFAITLTYSRGALLVLFLIIILFTLFNFRRIKSSIIIIIIFILSYGVNKILLVNVNSDIFNRATTIDLVDSSSSANYRIGYYSDAIKAIKQKPILGWGIGNWKIVGNLFTIDKREEYEVGYHVHNDFLHIAAETGIFGFSFYFLFLFYPAFYILKNLLDNNFNFNEIYIYIFLTFFIFFVDSNLNFPRARPTSIVNICLLIASTCSLINTKKNE